MKQPQESILQVEEIKIKKEVKVEVVVEENIEKVVEVIINIKVKIHIDINIDIITVADIIKEGTIIILIQLQLIVVENIHLPVVKVLLVLLDHDQILMIRKENIKKIMVRNLSRKEMQGMIIKSIKNKIIGKCIHISKEKKMRNQKLPSYFGMDFNGLPDLNKFLI
jgi:hypothetical protein